MTGVEAQLQFHLTAGISTGLTQNQLLELFEVIEEKVSKQQADKGRAILSGVREGVR